MNSVADLLSNVVNQFIVRPTGSAGFIGTEGFVFDVIGDEEVSFDADITDHYVESNYSIQDHIALRPPRFTLSGFVGELGDIFSNSFLNILTTVQSMSAIGEYELPFASQATQVYGKIAGIASQVGTVLNQASNAYQVLTGASTSTSKQQRAYNYFVKLYTDRTLCQVQTPWAVWSSMAIESIRIVQKADNNMISEFSVSFKQIRIVKTEIYDPNLNSGMQAVFDAGRSGVYNIPKSFIAGSAPGQDELPTGTPVTFGLLTQAGSVGQLSGITQR